MRQQPKQTSLSFCLYSLLILLLLLAHPFHGTAQKRYNHLIYKALLAADEKDYQTAIEIYQGILEKTPDHVDALTQMGICLVSNNASPDSALALFYKALSIIPKSDYRSDFGIELQLTIARTLKLAEKPDSALSILTRLQAKTTNRALKKELQEEITQTRNYAVLLNNPVPLEIKNLGHELNSEFDDNSPLVSFTGNRILFTSRRPSRNDHIMYDGQTAEKVFMSDFDGSKWAAPQLVGDLSTHNKHESILSISPDYNQLFLFKNNKGHKSIYTSHKVMSGKWTKPEKLPPPINSEWEETHACLSADRSTLFFTSSRPGGMGGLDIYMIKKNEFGKWGKPRNAGPNINSEKDEETPMLHPDGRTLYFSSEGHSSIGRFDIFYSQMLPDSTWTLPANMGYPINTPDDDFFFVPSLDKSRAYYASYRFENSAGRSDLYEVEFDSTYEGSLAVIEGTIHNENNLPTEQIRILVARNSDNQQVGDYRPDPATGKYLLFLESGQSYTIREATPYAITDSSILNVSESLAYDTLKQVLMVQDSRMIPPLMPSFRSNVNTHSLATISLKEQKIAEMQLDTTTILERPDIPAGVNSLTAKAQGEEIVVLDEYQGKETIPTKETRTKEVFARIEAGEETRPENTSEATKEVITKEYTKTTPVLPLTPGYTVQILALNKNPKAQEGYFDDLDQGGIASYKGTDGFLRYVIRQFATTSEAMAYRRQIQETGRYSDAFIRSWADLKALTKDPIPDETNLNQLTPIETPQNSLKTPENPVETPEEQRTARSSIENLQQPQNNQGPKEKAQSALPKWKYVVQVLALNKYPEPQEDYFNGLDQDKIVRHKGADGFVRYVTMEFESLAEAIAYRKKIQQSGRYSDAFIRRYTDINSNSGDLIPEDNAVPEKTTSTAKPVVKQNKADTKKKLNTAKGEKPEKNTATKEDSNAKVSNPFYTYTVQILALNKSPQPDKSFFDGLDQEHIIFYKGTDGYLRYIIRQFDSLAEASAFRKEIQKSGRFQDAFIRRYSDLKKLSEEE